MIDKGSPFGAMHLATGIHNHQRRIGILYILSKGIFFSIELCIFHFNRPAIIEIMNLFHFYFLNINISGTIYNIDLKFSVCVFNVLLERRKSQIYCSDPGLYFM